MGYHESADSPDPGRLLAGERKVLELISTGASLETTFDELCRVIDEQSGLRSSIFLLDGAAERLHLAAGPHLPDVWRRAVASFPVTATACGAAVTRREQMISQNVATDPMYAGFYEAAQEADISAAWSTPILSKHNRALGTFAVYSTVVGRPSALHLALVNRATHLARIAIDRQQAEDALRHSEQLLRLVLEAIPVGVGVTDHDGNIILNNPASNRIWGQVIESGPLRYATSRAWWHDTGRKVTPEQWASHRAIEKGETSINEVIDIESFDGVRKVIHNSAVPIRGEHQVIVGAVVVNEDVSAQKAAERELEASLKQMRMLTARVLHAQDDERRRIARLLHETTAQDLAGLKMLLARLNRTSDQLSDAQRAVLAESLQLAERSMNEARTVAYLLHPPFLDETGLLSAIRWYAQGFADRSGIHVDLDLPDALERLPQDVEMTLFRVVQEALINIHRHADSPTARISLRIATDQLTLEIEDHGRGITAECVAQLRLGLGACGVGLAGMRERLKQIGGALDVESSDRGTALRATVSFRAIAT
jgi:PAS domain S-box-containing protein